MSRNGAGVFTLPAASFPAVASTLIESAKFNANMNDIEAALTGSIAADGQTTITADLPMNSHKLTGLSAGSNSGDSVEYAQFAAKRSQLLSVSASVATNALTVQLDPCTLDFRSSTLTSGAVNARSVPAAISLVVPSGATLGTVNATQSRLILLAIDNSGTVELAIVNQSGGNNLDETTLISTTAITDAADSDNVIYSTAARASVPFRVVGFVESTQATAGTWASTQSLVQGMGGQALTAMSSLGYGQTWQTVTRNSGTTYYNTTGKPIYVAVYPTVVGTYGITVNGVLAVVGVPTVSSNASITAIVPPNANYVITSSGHTTTELR